MDTVFGEVQENPKSNNVVPTHHMQHESPAELLAHPATQIFSEVGSAKRYLPACRLKRVEEPSHELAMIQEI